MPRCADCGEVKPAEAFPRNRSRTSGVHRYCKACNNARNRESIRRLHGNRRHYHLTARYGIGASDVQALIDKQGGVCPICLRPNPTQVDHDHRTGRVRAILCAACNAGLGQFKDDPVRIRNTAAYLQKQETS